MKIIKIKEEKSNKNVKIQEDNPNKIIKIQDNKPKLLRIFYDLGNVCNYSCWYCFPDSNAGTTGWPDPEVIKHNLVHLIKYYRKNSNASEIQVHLLGGEPTVWKHLGSVVKFVKSQVKCKMCIFTNASRTIRWWKEFAEYFDHIGISVHHEKANIDHIIAVSNLLYDKRVSFYNDVLMDFKEWDKCVGIVNQLSQTKKKWPVFAKPLMFSDGNYYNEDQKKYLETQLKRKPSLINFLYHKPSRMKFKVTQEDGKTFTTRNAGYFYMNNLNHYEGWSCNLGVNFLFICRDGKVTGTCRQKLYGLNYYFDINDKDFIEKFNPEIKSVICEQKSCMCGGEAALTKRKI